MTTVNYTGRDFTSRYEALLAQFRVLVPELTDLNHSNAGIAMIRLLASESDFLSFYIDWVFNSGYVETAAFKQSLINIGKAMDTLPKLASAARTEVTVTRISGVTGSITIPKYTRFERIDGVGYLTDADVILSSAETTASIPVTQGDLVEVTVDIDEFDAIDHSRKLRYNMGANVAAYTSSVVDTDTSIAWEEVESLYRTTSDDLHYYLELYAQPLNGIQDTTYLTLCKKTTDADLPSSLDVTYIQTLGLDGNTGAGTITVCPSALEYTITATNSDPATGGGPCESAADLRWRIPTVARTQRRGVIKDDYQVLVMGISGVKYCEIFDRNDIDDWPHLYLAIYVTTEGGGAMSSYLRQAILSQCSALGHLGTWTGRYLLFDATQIPVNINARVGITSGHTSVVVFSNIQTALQNSYGFDNATSLKDWSFSGINYVIESVTGVDWVEFNEPTTSISAGDGEILVLGSVTLTQGT